MAGPYRAVRLTLSVILMQAFGPHRLFACAISFSRSFRAKGGVGLFGLTTKVGDTLSRYLAADCRDHIARPAPNPPARIEAQIAKASLTSSSVALWSLLQRTATCQRGWGCRRVRVENGHGQ